MYQGGGGPPIKKIFLKKIFVLLLSNDDGDMHGTDGVESGDVLLWQKLMVTMVCNASETGLLQS